MSGAGQPGKLWATLATRRGGLAAALLLSGALVGLQHRLREETHSRFDLPDFDAHVNLAMAEHPAVFTQAPQGFRILTPWIVASLPAPKATRGFRHVTLAALVAAGGALFLLLRRLRVPPWTALTAVALLGLSEPVGQALAHGFLAEPVDLALLLVLLWAVEAGAGPGVSGLLLAVGALSSDLPFLLLPVLALRHAERGPRHAAAATLVAALPALAAALLLRGFWSAAPAAPLGSLALTPETAGGLRPLPWDYLGPVTLGGVVPLAALGALRPEGRRFLLRYGYLLAAATALPFLPGLVAIRYSSLFDPGPPLLLVALAFWLPLSAIGLAAPAGAAAPRRAPSMGTEMAAYLAAFATLAAVASGLDRYRRADLGGRRDGPLALALTRESLRTARRLERGHGVRLDERRRYAWGLSDPGRLGRMRWFLWGGWGELAHYGIGEIAMRGSRARLLLPSFGARDLEAELVMESARPVRLAVFLNGLRVGSARAGPGSPRSLVPLPRRALFRGDNVLTLLATRGEPGSVRLRALTYRPAPAEP
jgi:hypothetical protein